MTVKSFQTNVHTHIYIYIEVLICRADTIGCLSFLGSVGKGLAVLSGRAPTSMALGLFIRGDAAQTTPWLIAVKGTCQSLHRTLTQPFLNTNILSWSWLSLIWPNFYISPSY